MGLSKMLKSNAKHAMSGAWGRAVGILFIAAIPTLLINLLEYAIRLVSGVPEFVDYAGTPNVAFDDLSNLALASSLISVLILILMFIITTPLQQGVLRWYYRRTGGEDDGVSAVFYYFETAKDYFKSFWLYFQIGLRMLLWEILLAIPLLAGGGVLVYAMRGLDGELPPVVKLAAGILAVIWVTIMAILSVMISLRYMLAPYILAEHPEIKVRKAIKQGVRLVKGYKGSLFVFGLSFIGWYLLCIFIVPAFFVLPYVAASFAMYARYLIARGEMELAPEGGNATREYKPEIDHYVETQDAASQSASQEPQPVVYPPAAQAQELPPDPQKPEDREDQP